VQGRATVLVHKRVAKDHYLMRLNSPLVARRALPGQFVHVRCALADHPLLRRPFSLLDADPGKGTIDFLYKVVGLGTQVLAQVSAGDRVDILGPLGRPFEIPGDLRTAYFVGGGVGIPPLFLLAKHLLKKKNKGTLHKGTLFPGGDSPLRTVPLSPNGASPIVHAFLGARKKEWVICISDFLRLGIPVQVATDDGSLGYHGSVVDLLRRFLRKEKRNSSGGNGSGSEILYICGPTPMMAAAAELARQERLPAQVSLEERMGCAMGCCMGCVVEIATEPANSHKRFQRVCTEGPVFPAQVLAWKES